MWLLPVRLCWWIRVGRCVWAGGGSRWMLRQLMWPGLPLAWLPVPAPPAMMVPAMAALLFTTTAPPMMVPGLLFTTVALAVVPQPALMVCRVPMVRGRVVVWGWLRRWPGPRLRLVC